MNQKKFHLKACLGITESLFARRFAFEKSQDKPLAYEKRVDLQKATPEKTLKEMEKIAIEKGESLEKFMDKLEKTAKDFDKKDFRQMLEETFKNNGLGNSEQGWKKLQELGVKTMEVVKVNDKDKLVFKDANEKQIPHTNTAEVKFLESVILTNETANHQKVAEIFNAKVGDKISVYGGSEAKDQYRAQLLEDGKFHYLTKSEKTTVVVTLIPTQKIRFLSRQSENTDTNNWPEQLKLNEKSFLVVGKVPKTGNSVNYLEVATQILNGNSGNYAIDKAYVESIQKEFKTPEQYAELLKTADQQVKDRNFLPVVSPQLSGKKSDNPAFQEKAATDAKFQQALKLGETLATDATKVLEQVLKNPGQLKRSVDPSLQPMMEKDGAEFKQNFREGNLAGIKEIKDVMARYNKILGSGSEGLENKIYSAINIGSSETFDPEDIVKAFGITIPDGKSYAEILEAVAQNPTSKYSDTVIAVELLTSAIEKLRQNYFQRTIRNESYEGSGLESKSLKQPAGVRVNLEKADTLNQDIPGRPMGTNERLYKNNKLLRNAQELLAKIGPAKIIDTPENLRSLNENDGVAFNVRAGGRDFTLQILNPTANFSWIFKLAPGFNQKNFNQQFSTTGFDSNDAFKSIDTILRGGKLPNNISSMEANPNEKSVTFERALLDDFNQKLGAGYELDEKQFLELVFRLNSFKELSEQKAFVKVEKEPNVIALVQIPKNIMKDGKTSLKVAQLAYAIKHGILKPGDGLFQENIRENDPQIKLTNLVNRIFVAESSTFDAETGHATNMPGIRAGELSTDTPDLYYQGFAGKGGLDAFKESGVTEIVKGKEVLNEAKVMKRLKELYVKGIKYLERLDNQKNAPAYYREMAQKIKNPDKSWGDVKTGPNVTLDRLGQWEISIIRLGLKEDEREKEAVETAQEDEFREKLVKEATPEMTKLINGQELLKKEGYSVTDIDMKESMRQLPVSILLNLRNTVNMKGERVTAAGLYVPVVLPLKKFPKGQVSLVIIPGLDTQGIVNLAVGLAAEWQPHERIKVFGGISAGVNKELLPSASISAGAKVNVYKADETGNWDNYLGAKFAAGIGKIDGGGLAGMSIGLVYERTLNIQQKYNNEFKERLISEGLTEEYLQLLMEGKTKELADKVKQDPALSKNLKLKAGAPDAEIESVLKDYITNMAVEFQEHFDIPRITGGEVNVTAGALILAGAVTGNAPLMIGASTTFAFNLLGSLNINVRKEIFLTRKQNRSEDRLGAYESMTRQKAYTDAAFNEMLKSADQTKLAKAEEAGVNSLNGEGVLRTSESGGFESISNRSLLDYNEKFETSGIRFEKDPTGRIKLVFLPVLEMGNTKVLISDDIAVKEGNDIYLRKPNELRQLWTHLNTRKYPFEVGEKAKKFDPVTGNYREVPGATRLNVVTITNGPNDLKPIAIEMTRLEGEKDFAIQENIPFQGTAEAYKDISMSRDDIINMNKRIMKGLGAPETQEDVRENIKPLAAQIYPYSYIENGKTIMSFVEITNRSARRNLANPDYTKQELFKFFDKYMQDRQPQAKPLNPSEKEALLIECAGLRYVYLEDRSPKGYETRLNWSRDNVLPNAFEARIRDLQKKGFFKGLTSDAEIKAKAAELARQAVKPLYPLSPDQQINTLPPNTSANVSVGKGGNALLSLLNATYKGEKANEGYIIGQDLTEALRNPKHVNHDLALVLLEQMAPLPTVDEKLDNKEAVDKFMNTPLAREIASLKALAFVLGKKNYDQLTNYYETAGKPLEGNKEGVSEFIKIVKEIRKAEEENLSAKAITGFDGIQHTFLLKMSIKTGIFNKCANFSTLYNEKVRILPTPEELSFLGTKAESRTGVLPEAVARFYNLTGGVSMDVGTGGGKAVPLNKPSRGGRVDQTGGDQTPQDKPITNGQATQIGPKDKPKSPQY